MKKFFVKCLEGLIVSCCFLAGLATLYIPIWLVYIRDFPTWWLLFYFIYIPMLLYAGLGKWDDWDE